MNKLIRNFALFLGLATSFSALATDAQVVVDAKSAANWIASALTSSGYQSDFTLESLKEIDRFIDEQAPGGKPKAGSLLSEKLGARLFALGAYTGEVILRSSGGAWKADDNDPQAEINIAIVQKNGTESWPVQRVMKRLKNGQEDSVFAYGVALLNR